MAKESSNETKKSVGPEKEQGKGIRNFRALPDIESFYRFIHENNLRREAHNAVEYLVSVLKRPKKRGRKAKKTLQ